MNQYDRPAFLDLVSRSDLPALDALAIGSILRREYREAGEILQMITGEGALAPTTEREEPQAPTTEGGIKAPEPIDLKDGVLYLAHPRVERFYWVLFGYKGDFRLNLMERGLEEKRYQLIRNDEFSTLEEGIQAMKRKWIASATDREDPCYGLPTLPPNNGIEHCI